MANFMQQEKVGVHEMSFEFAPSVCVDFSPGVFPFEPPHPFHEIYELHKKSRLRAASKTSRGVICTSIRSARSFEVSDR